MDEEIIQRLDALEESVAALMGVVKATSESFLCSGMILSARLEALQKVTAESLNSLGIESSTHPTLLAQMKAMEREACENQLRRTSDNDPNLATALKVMIDRTFKG